MKLEKIGSALKEQFSSFRQKRQDAESMLRGIKADIRALEQEAAAIRSAPVTRDDFIAAALSAVSAAADEGRERLKNTVCAHLMHEGKRNHFKGAISASQLQWGVVQNGGRFDNNGPLLVTASRPDEWNFSGKLDFVSLCTLFEDAIKASFTANITSFDWPYPNAQTTEVRVARLAEIDSWLEGLRINESELQQMLGDMVSG